MKITEKAAYLKGLADGLGVLSDSKEGKLDMIFRFVRAIINFFIMLFTKAK